MHAADLHLDTQPSGLHGYPAEVGEVLRDASLRAFDNLIDEALQRKVAFCVFAGDVYDGAGRGARAELAFRRGLVRLAEAGIRSFVVHGNHDPVDEGWSTISQWPDAATVFGTGTPQTVTFGVDGATVAVHGISYATRHTEDNLAARFVRHPGADVQIGVLHTNVGDVPGHGNYAPCSIGDLASVGLDYWALGHVHDRRVLAGPDPWVVYPGNTQGRHAGASERGRKGAVVVTVGDDAGVGEPEFVALDVLRFVSLELHIDDLADPGELTDELSRRCTQLRADHDGRALVVRTALRGSGRLHDRLADPAVRADILDALRAEWLGRTPVVWWDAFEDLTTGAVDIGELAGRDDFTGNTVRAIGSGADTAALEGELARLGNLSPSLRRLGIEVPCPADPGVTRRARVLAAHLLGSGGT